MASTRQAALFLAAFAALATAPDAAPIAPSNDTCIDDELFEPPAFSDLTSPAESTAPSSVTLNFSAAADGPNATLDAGVPSSVEEPEAAAPDARRARRRKAPPLQRTRRPPRATARAGRARGRGGERE